jgi:hypothetical protein
LTNVIVYAIIKPKAVHIKAVVEVNVDTIVVKKSILLYTLKLLCKIHGAWIKPFLRKGFPHPTGGGGQVEKERKEVRFLKPHLPDLGAPVLRTCS